MSERPRCETCLWWQRLKTDILGECHGSVPKPLAVMLNFEMHWPVTRHDDFCRGHQPLPVRQVSEGGRP